MLDRKLIEAMYDTAVKSELQGARSAAAVYRRMLEMPLGSQMTVRFQEGEDFIVTRREEGYEVA
ncbi:hypothetical protein FYJ74_01120 [Pyramidobacter sp. SM-530-WT-4B]|uniref:Uncharacterized protein n=1 Tax=Pyramidobacter porci TaxID=2605789 RepID=A0A6L5Y983_9BACT|nr:hypothetical protein [Pyramidobacter porci]MDY2648652.1 hypothetical protein [Pyramidobacter porci]MST54655.1 hypothetical protein [Pyramidobacter porci]